MDMRRGRKVRDTPRFAPSVARASLNLTLCSLCVAAVGCMGYSDAQSSLFTLSLFAGLITRYAGGTVQSSQISVDQSEWNISPIAPLGQEINEGTLYPAHCFWDPSQPEGPSFLVYISVNATAGCNPWAQLGRVNVLTGKVEPLKYTRPSLPYTGTFDWTSNAELRNAIALDWKRQLLVEVLRFSGAIRTTNLVTGEVIVYPTFNAQLVEAGGWYTTLDIAHGRLVTNAGQSAGSAYFGLVLTIDYLTNGQIIWATAQGEYGGGYLPFGLLYPNEEN